MTRAVIAVSVVASAVAGCGGLHIAEYTPKDRTYTQPVEAPEAASTDEDGSLFVEQAALLSAVEDVRALGINDIVVVKIMEVAKAKRGASTDVEKDGGLDFSLGMGAGAVNNISASLGYESKNEGETARHDDVRFTVAATVKQKFTNGNLFVEGHRVVMVNNEEHHYYISGVARPADIDATNSIRSDRLADAHVELTGQGIVSDAQEPGWLTKFFKWISLF